MIADRLNKIESKIWQDCFERAARNPKAIDLSIGFPQEDTPATVKSAGITAIEQNFTRYMPAQGYLPLRQKIAQKLNSVNNIEANAENIAITPGLATGHLSVFLSLLNPGDEVIIFEPYFSPYKYLVEMLGAKAVIVPTFPSFLPDVKEISQAITKKTKLIIINSPNNPTGAIYPEKLLRQIADVLKPHNITVMSDEIFEYFAYDQLHFSIGSIYPNTLTLNGFSKSHAMTGWRIGYIAGPPELIAAINKLQQYTVFSTSSIAQKAAMAAVDIPPLPLSAYRERCKLVKTRLGEFGELAGACGAIFAFFKLPAGASDLEFVERAAEQGILLLPGRAFTSHNNYARLSYGVNTSDLKKGLDILGKLLKQYYNQTK